MADFLGTTGDDELDQVKLKLADWSGTIRGLAGNDKMNRPEFRGGQFV